MEIKREIINGKEIEYVVGIDDDEIEKNDEINYEDTIDLKDILTQLEENYLSGDSNE